MKKAKIRVTFELEVEHDGTWSHDELLQISEDMCQPSFPDGWTSEGLEDFAAKCTTLEMVDFEE